MVLLKPATVVQWHRQGFLLYWRWRSRRRARPKMSAEIRDLIRKLCGMHVKITAPNTWKASQKRSCFSKFEAVYANRELSWRDDRADLSKRHSIYS
jgi:hypothetical protein